MEDSIISLIWRLSIPVPEVEHVPGPISEKVDGKNSNEDGQIRDEREPPDLNQQLA